MDIYTATQNFENERVEVVITKYDFFDAWEVRLEKSDDGVKLKVTVESSNGLEAAICEAHDKFFRSAREGIKGLSGPLLTYTAPTASSYEDDEIPF